MSSQDLPYIVDQMNTGMIVLALDGTIVDWNRFLAAHAKKSLADVLNIPVYDVFPELPKRWFERKLNGVVQLKTPFFCSWEQRHHLFKLPHNRPITTDSEYMAQNCTFLPLEIDGIVDKVCILIEDATDVCFYQTSLKQMMAELEAANRIDGLTQIYNRKYWQESLTIEFSRAQRHNNSLTLLMFDLDHFKKVNDVHGHQCGDIVLVETARRIKKLLRACDIFGRYGGEEFAIVLPETDLIGAYEVAERIRHAVSSIPVIFEGKKISFSVSIGLATIDENISSTEMLISLSDKALYEAKSSGRNQINSAQELTYKNKSIA